MPDSGLVDFLGGLQQVHLDGIAHKDITNAGAHQQGGVAC